MKSLFDEVRSEQNVFSAWRHVKRSALSSGSPEIRGSAAEFEHEHQRHLFRIIRQLREGTYKFDPVTGVLKDKQKRIAQGKKPRPIAIASIQNRVVQRAILQVLQPRVLRDLRDIDSRSEAINDERLGRINDVNTSPYGVGGLIHPYGGVRPAIGSILKSMTLGGEFFYQSDIKEFFTRIPTDRVVHFVREETEDEAFSSLFEKGLEVHLGNADELIGYADLFPNNGIGVAQGSSLSAFAGNVLLFDMDRTLNSMGVTAIRYIDDILIVGKDEQSLDTAVRYARDTLEGFGFGLYNPDDGLGKAARGKCSDAIHFLGCTLQPNRCIPSAESVKKIKASITETLSRSKSAIKEATTKGTFLEAKLSQSATLEMLGKRLYGWQKSFGFCTEPGVFKQIDDYAADQVEAYQGAVGRYVAKAERAIRMSVIGLPSMRKLFEDGTKNKSK